MFLLLVCSSENGSSLHGRGVLDQKDISSVDGCKQTSHTNHNNKTHWYNTQEIVEEIKTYTLAIEQPEERNFKAHINTCMKVHITCLRHLPYHI